MEPEASSAHFAVSWLVAAMTTPALASRTSFWVAHGPMKIVLQWQQGHLRRKKMGAQTKNSASMSKAIMCGVRQVWDRAMSAFNLQVQFLVDC